MTPSARAQQAPILCAKLLAAAADSALPGFGGGCLPAPVDLDEGALQRWHRHATMRKCLPLEPHTLAVELHCCLSWRPYSTALGEVGNAAEQVPADAGDAQAIRADGADQADAHSGAFDDGDCLGELGSPGEQSERQPSAPKTA